MRRTVLVPTVVASVSRSCQTLVAVSLFAVLALALALASPAAAQEETTDRTRATAGNNNVSGKQEQSVRGSGQQADDASQRGDEESADPLEGQTANIEENAIGPIAVAGCEVVAGEAASITVADADSTEAVFTEDENTVFRFGAQGITIAPEGDELAVAEDFEPGTGEVVRTDGILCDGGGQRADGTVENEAEVADDIQDLSCDELLVLFRAESSGEQQYPNFSDAGVRAQIEVCLEEEILKGTAADEDLPDTGGVSLLALAVLGLVSVAAGFSVIRGGRR